MQLQTTNAISGLGLNLQTVGQDLSAAVGGNFVNRFSVAGRSYKVIPQLLRVERLNPEQLRDVHVTGPGGQLVSLGSLATIRDTVTPRSLNRFQQLNAVKISGAPSPLMSAAPTLTPPSNAATNSCARSKRAMAAGSAAGE